MKKLLLNLLFCFSLCLNWPAGLQTLAPAELVIHEIRYDGHLADDDAQFTLLLDATAPAQRPAVLTARPPFCRQNYRRV